MADAYDQYKSKLAVTVQATGCCNGTRSKEMLDGSGTATSMPNTCHECGAATLRDNIGTQLEELALSGG